jgi:hypothetical protein
MLDKPHFSRNGNASARRHGGKRDPGRATNLTPWLFGLVLAAAFLLNVGCQPKPTPTGGICPWGICSR